MTISADSDIRNQSVSADAAYAKLAGTPLAPYAGLFVSLSQQYGIDLNWILSYLQWENGFGAANTFSMAFNDPWDMLCGTPGNPCDGSSPPWGALRCERAPNGYCYWVFPDMATGIEAGYKNWASYVASGWTSWFTSLSVALCGNPAGCAGSNWVANVIAQGDENAAQWPYVGPPPPPPIWVLASPGLLVILGGMMLFGATLLWQYFRPGGLHVSV